MTGGGFGRCNPSGAGYGRSYGRGFGRGRGRGRGYGRGIGWRGFYPAWGGWHRSPYGGPYAADPKDEAQMLEDEANALRAELDSINRRIHDLESQSSEPGA